MRRLLLSLALLAAAALPAHAADDKSKRTPSPAQQAQQEKMRTCSTMARGQGLQAEPRKAFMKDCLARKPA